MDKYCIIVNSDKDKGNVLSNKICQKFKEYGKECFILSNISELSDDIKTAIVLGGDGTILQAAKDLLRYDIPILGINKGTLGFMTEIEISDIDMAVEALIKKEYNIEERLMLKGNIVSGNTVFCTDVALNDIIVARSGFSRIITVNVYVNGELVNSYNGDGVIVCSPTGSTGYNLSAGGPIVKPDSKLMVITPICPHSMSSRSIVISANDNISIEVGRSKKTQKEEAIVNFDGREGINLKSGDRININKAKNVTKIINISGKSFFDVIREKFDGTF